jgi:hypothetical protein
MKRKFILLKSILVLFILSFAFIGGECDKFFNPDTKDILGRWLLVKMEGDLQDVCLGEKAEFQTAEVVLTCPGKTPITRSYTYLNNIVTYSQTGVSYDVSFNAQNGINKMIFTGRGIQRKLTYDKQR